MDWKGFETVARHPRVHAVLRVTAALVLLSAAERAGSAGAKADKVAPEIAGATTARGKTVSLEEYRGKWVVLTFGASWCVPCKKELPAWQKLAADYRKRRVPVVFVAVNVDESAAQGKRFMKGLGLRNMCLLFDPGRRAVERYDPPKMPTTYVLDPTGVVRHIHPGYHAGDEKKLVAVLDRLIAG